MALAQVGARTNKRCEEEGIAVHPSAAFICHYPSLAMLGVNAISDATEHHPIRSEREIRSSKLAGYETSLLVQEKLNDYMTLVFRKGPLRLLGL